MPSPAMTARRTLRAMSQEYRASQKQGVTSQNARHVHRTASLSPCAYLLQWPAGRTIKGRSARLIAKEAMCPDVDAQRHTQLRAVELVHDSDCFQPFPVHGERYDAGPVRSWIVVRARREHAAETGADDARAGLRCADSRDPHRYLGTVVQREHDCKTAAANACLVIGRANSRVEEADLRQDQGADCYNEDRR